MTVTPERIAEIREKAQAARPGGEVEYTSHDIGPDHCVWSYDVDDIGSFNREEDAVFYAFAREALLDLLAALDAAKERANTAETERDRMREALQAYDHYDSLPTDRGGKKGSKGKAFANFLTLKAAALPQEPS